MPTLLALTYILCVGCWQAGESNLRTLDKRETANTNASQQGMVEMELRLRDMSAEMTRFKRHVETETRAAIDGIRTDLRHREGMIQQLDAAARGLALQVIVCATVFWAVSIHTCYLSSCN